MKKYIKGLVKVTSKECYAKNFRDGKLYMNELRYYTKCEQRELGDKLEGRSLTIYANNVPIHCIDSMALCFPVFCMYGLYDSKYGNTKFVSICPKMKAFGKYAVVVTDVQKFLERIEATGLEFSPVKYQNPDKNNYDSRIPFRPEYRKVKYFKYQQEFRIRKPDLLLTKTVRKSTKGLKQKTRIIMNILSLVDYMILPAKLSQLRKFYSRINIASNYLLIGKIWSLAILSNMKSPN